MNASGYTSSVSHAVRDWYLIENKNNIAFCTTFCACQKGVNGKAFKAQILISLKRWTSAVFSGRYMGEKRLLAANRLYFNLFKPSSNFTYGQV
jgi:hypothetical protein